MDTFSEVLFQSGLSRRNLERLSVEGRWRFAMPCDRSMGFHLVTDGKVQIWSDESGFVTELEAGSVALMARGVDHELRVPEHQKAGLVSGVYFLWENPIHPFFQEIPPWSILQRSEYEAFGEMATIIQLISQEAKPQRPGSGLATQALMDLLLVQAFRTVLNRAPTRTGWSHTLQDPVLSRVLEKMHHQMDKDWDLPSLAREVGLSRTALASQFKNSLGESPGHYLAKVRIQHALTLLQTTEDSLEVIARRVGYGDAFSFSKAFKKHVGKSPREARRAHQE